MLHILFILLKIIGIIIAAVLGLVLAILLLVFFVPLRYRIEGSCDETPDTLKIRLKFSWLLHLIAGQYVYEEGKLKKKLRIVWKIFGEEKEPQKKEAQEKQLQEKQPAKEKDTKKIKETAETEKKTAEEKKISEKKAAGKQPSGEKRKTAKKKQTIMDKVKGFFRKIKYTFVKICDNIKMLIEKKERISEFLNHEIHRNAFVSTKNELLRLLRFLKPKKVRGRIHFGFEDPYITGKVLAGASICYPFYGDMLVVEPSFEEKVLEGEVQIKGCIRGIHLLIVLWNLLMNKEIRTTYQHIKEFQL